MQLSFSQAALVDYARIMRWISRNRTRRIADAIVRDIQKCFRQIESNPELNEEIRPGSRLAVTTKYSYLVVYKHNSDGIVITKIVHASQSPESWEQDDDSDDEKLTKAT
jgi:plasmid stabilization system protein ParE